MDEFDSLIRRCLAITTKWREVGWFDSADKAGEFASESFVSDWGPVATDILNCYGYCSLVNRSSALFERNRVREFFYGPFPSPPQSFAILRNETAMRAIMWGASALDHKKFHRCMGWRDLVRTWAYGSLVECVRRDPTERFVADREWLECVVEFLDEVNLRVSKHGLLT